MHSFPEPESVFQYFAELSAIPRGSGNTAGIRQWCLDKAAALGISAHADSAGNVILKKAATPGYETHPPVILQGHLDMVCAKLPDCPVNMETEPPQLIWNDDFVCADGTTLGGDDGIAIAYAFALLERSDLPHPPLTVLLTNDEETGMDGADGLQPSELTGDLLINLDSEEEGILTVGCAGGVRVHMNIPFETELFAGTIVKLTLHGLIGGHSGTEIHKPLMNAVTAITGLLAAVRIPYRLISVEGGVRDNVIPTSCTVQLTCDETAVFPLCEKIAAGLDDMKTAYPSEIHAELSTESTSTADGRTLTAQATEALIRFLRLIPNGVQEVNSRLQMPETSLNLGIICLENGILRLDSLIRSGSNSKKEALAALLCQMAENEGGEAEESGRYPAWEYQPDTRLEQAAVRVYRRLYHKKMTVRTIHAGLECGILSAKKPALQCISIGPDLFDVHTPRERLSVPSAARTWKYLTELLAEL